VKILKKILKTHWEGRGWLDLAERRDKWRVVANVVMNIRFPWNSVNFLTSGGTVSFSKESVLHGVASPTVYSTWRAEGVERCGQAEAVQREATDSNMRLVYFMLSNVDCVMTRNFALHRVRNMVQQNVCLCKQYILITKPNICTSEVASLTPA